MIESTFSDKIVLYSNVGAIHVAMNTTELVIKIRPGKNSGPYGIWIHDLCDTGAVLYQLS